MEQTKATFPSTCASTFELAFAVAALQTQSEAPPQDHSNATNEKEQCQSGLEHDPNQDACQRLERSRERNREHARRTRLRKKAQLQALQSKVRDLEAERQTLKQSVEECSIASILLGLSNKEQDTVDMIDTSKEDERASKIALLSSCKRRRFVSDAGVKSEPITILIDGEETAIGNGRSQINWKTGLYTDDDGECKQLTSDQLESLRYVSHTLYQAEPYSSLTTLARQTRAQPHACQDDSRPQEELHCYDRTDYCRPGGGERSHAQPPVQPQRDPGDFTGASSDADTRGYLRGYFRR